MKYTQVASDAFAKLQLNAGILLTEFDPTDPPSTAQERAEMRENIFAATSGGVSFATNPEYVDFGEDIDNVPPNTKQLKRLQSVSPTMSGTLKTADTAVAKALMGAADVNAQTGKVTPRGDLADGDFFDIWWVGDYSDKNGNANGGYLAIKLANALSTGGLQLQSNDDGKGDFSFELTGHYDIANIDQIPYEVWVKAGTAEA